MANRRAPKPVVNGALALELMVRDGCTWCGCSFDASTASLEYRVPPRKGEEASDLDNLVAVCFTCSQSTVRRVRFPQGLLVAAAEVEEMGFSEMVRVALAEWLRSRQHNFRMRERDEQKVHVEEHKRAIQLRKEIFRLKSELTVKTVKDKKLKPSTKMIGESLEQHCENQFNTHRAMAFPNAYFEKDSGRVRKGNYVFRESDENGVEFISIMFEMKNVSDTTKTKKKNDDFLKKLDKDREAKGCEYAVLVSLLEGDHELYNSGIVDMSSRYPKMYVVRPQFFIPMITLLRNAAMNEQMPEICPLCNHNALQENEYQIECTVCGFVVQDQEALEIGANIQKAAVSKIAEFMEAEIKVSEERMRALEDLICGAWQRTSTWHDDVTEEGYA